MSDLDGDVLGPVLEDDLALLRQEVNPLHGLEVEHACLLRRIQLRGGRNLASLEERIEMCHNALRHLLSQDLRQGVLKRSVPKVVSPTTWSNESWTFKMGAVARNDLV